MQYLSSLLVAFSPHSQQSSQQEVVDFKLCVNLRKCPNSTQNLAQQQTVIKIRSLLNPRAWKKRNYFSLKPWKHSLSKIFKFSDVFLKYWLYSVDYRPKKWCLKQDYLVCNHILNYITNLIHTCPTILSARHNVGSIFVPTPNKRFTSWTNSFQNLWLVMSWKQFTHLNYPTNKASRHCKLKVILLSKQRHNARENGTALQFPLTVLWNNTWPHFYFLAHLQMNRKSKPSHSCCKCLLHQLSWIASNHFDLGILKKEQKTSKGCLITHVLDW